MQSAGEAKQTLTHLQTFFPGLFHPVRGGMLINVGKKSDFPEKCGSMYACLSDVMHKNGKKFQDFLEFRRLWSLAAVA